MFYLVFFDHTKGTSEKAEVSIGMPSLEAAKDIAQRLSVYLNDQYISIYDNGIGFTVAEFVNNEEVLND